MSTRTKQIIAGGFMVAIVFYTIGFFVSPVPAPDPAAARARENEEAIRGAELMVRVLIRERAKNVSLAVRPQGKAAIDLTWEGEDGKPQSLSIPLPPAVEAPK